MNLLVFRKRHMKRRSLHINENYRAFVVRKFKSRRGISSDAAFAWIVTDKASVDRAGDVDSLIGISASLDKDRADHHKAIGQRGLP
jgi:hypothetical protein